MTSKFLLPLVTALSMGLSAFAQQFGSITGKVVTSDGSPAQAISVSISGNAQGASTNENGEYIIKRVKPGNYTVVATAIGIAKSSKTVEVKIGETATVDFVLLESNQVLKEVSVSSRNKNKTTTSVAKQALSNLENPQVYSSVSAETMKEQAISHYDDALRNVPGISRTWESTGRGGDGASYFALRGFEAQAGLVNGLPGVVSGNLDPANVELIQVMKGPSGTLFGASFYGYGGIINTITKKPYYNFGGEVGYYMGSFGLNRLTVDLNAPLSKTEKIAFRLNAAGQTENTFQNAGFKQSIFVAPSFVYEVNNKLTFHLNAELLEEERAVAPVFFNTDRESPLDFKNIAELNLDNRQSFINNDLRMKNPRKNLQAQAIYKLDSHWNSQTVFSVGNIKSKGLYSYIYGTDPNFPTERNYFIQSFNGQDFSTNTYDVQQNFNGDFNLGKLRNRLLIGLDFFSRTVTNKSAGYIDTRRVTPQGDFISYDPINNPTGLDANYIAQTLDTTAHSNSRITNSAYSAYASNVLNITPSLSVLASLRVDYFKNTTNEPGTGYTQTTLSPRFGLVYQPVLDKISIFANYMNAFYNVAPSEIFDDAGVSLGIKTFKPEEANQLEFGLKTNLLADKLFATISVYNIRVGNRVYYTPTSAVQGGKTQSRGLELELNASPTPQLNLIAGFSHGKLKVVEGNSATPTDFYNEVGRSPGGQGPQTLANVWANYKFKGSLKNFGAGAGINYAGKYDVIDNSVTGIFSLPSYTLLNASLFYNPKHFRIAVNVNNITNETYYIGYWSVNPQKPANFTASLAYKF